MPRTRLVICSLLFCLVLIPAATARADWTYLRGPSFQGEVADARIPLKWSEKENILWKVSLPGMGASSPIVQGGRIFLTASSPDGTERTVLCVSADDGKLLWQQTAAKGVQAEKTHGWNGYASPSCATDGKLVFAFFGTHGLFCYDIDGKFQWKHEFGILTSQTGWGVAASPFLFDDLVIQNCDNDGPAGLPQGAAPNSAAPAALVALEKATGKVRWTTPRNQGRGFGTPRLVTNPSGRVDLVLNGPLGVWAYDPSTGKEVWHCDRTDPGDKALFGEPIPITDGKVLYAPSGRPGPFQAIRLDGTGDVTKSHLVWQVQRGKHRDVSSQIVLDGLIYAGDNKAMLTCHDAATGKAIYDESMGARKKSLASPLLVDGKLLFLLDDGETVIVQPGREFKVVGRNVLDGKPLDFCASPAVAGGKLFIRSQSHLYCIGEKK